MSSIVQKASQSIRSSPIVASVYGFLALSTIVYIYITYRADVLNHHGHNDFVTFLVTHLVILVPEVVVWLIAATGALRLKAYARTAIRGQDGIAFDYIADALMLLVIYSVAISLATSVKILFVHTSVFKMASIITVHAPVVLVLLSSIFLYIGAVELNRIASMGLKKLPNRLVELAISAFNILVASFVWYFYAVAPHRIDDDGRSHFALPVSILLVTYVLPHIITWLLGLMACLNLAHYAKYVKGTIYKAFLRDLYLGILIVFGCTYFAQVLYVSNISSRHFNPALLLVFLVLIALMAGYLMIYRGASRLQLIEGK